MLKILHTQMEFTPEGQKLPKIARVNYALCLNPLFLQPKSKEIRQKWQPTELLP